MNSLVVTERILDRNYSASDLVLNGKSIQGTNISALLKSTRPDEVDLLYKTKAQYNLDHVESFVVRLFDAPKIYFPKIDRITNRKHSLEKFIDKPVQDPFQVFLQQMVSIPDVGFEFLFYDRNREKIRDFATLHDELNPLIDYFDLLQKNKDNLKENPKKFVHVNKLLHDTFWQDLFARQEAKRREAMIGRILDYERKYFDYDNPPANFVNSHEMFKFAIQINETSQAIAYSNERECATSFTLHSSVLLDDDLIEKILQYLEKDKTKLTILKFKELDLRAKVDYTMRDNFKKILGKISEIKQDKKNKAFMLLEAGNQYAVCLPIFDLISRSLSMIDGDIGYGRNGGRGQFWDSTKNYPRRANEMEQVFENDPERFRQTNEVGHGIVSLKNLKITPYNKIRRQYFLASLNQQAVEMKRHTIDGTSEIYLNQILRNSELSPLRDLILN